MAQLLAMYQKMRLIREKNQLTLEQATYSSKLTRVQKNIERVQKRYNSILAQVDSQAKMMQSQATVMFNNMMGLSTGNFDLNNFGGINNFVLDRAHELCGQEGAKISQEQFKELYNIFMSNNQSFPQTKDENGNITDYGVPGSTIEEQQNAIKAFQFAISCGQQMQNYARQYVQNANNQYASNVSIWTEAKKAEIEAEQDAVLEPLNYQQTMLELEKEQRDMRLQRIQTELENYEQLVSNEAKNSAPSFGLR